MNFFTDLGRGIKAVFKGPASKDNLFNLDHRTSLRETIPFGLQHHANSYCLYYNRFIW